MASSPAKSNKNFRRQESRNKHSWWWDSHISGKNSKWLAENLEEMDQSVKRMLKLIEEEGDSFAKKAEMYYQKRPELVSHVEEFYRMYRSLAERYDNVTGELRKNIPSDLQSQGSGISDVGSEPLSTVMDHRLGRRGSGARAAGFDVFLKNGGSCSDLGTKEGDETSTLDSESESDDDSSINNYSSASANSDSRGLRKRITELEKFQTQQEENLNEKIRVSEEVIGNLRNELRKYETMTPEDVKTYVLEAEFSEQEHKIRSLEAELKMTREKLVISNEEVKKLKHELENNSLQEKLGSAQKDISGWKTKLDKEKREVSKLQDRITRYKANLSERDREIRGLKETLSNANKSLSEENRKLEEQVTKMLKERALLDDTIKELDLKCQCSEEDLRRIKILKTEMEMEIERLKSDKRDLEGELSFKDDEIDVLKRHLDELQVENVELVDRIEELRCKSEELEREIKRQREVIEVGAEEKREVIRQLCFSLEHYRDKYQNFRQAFVGHNKRHPVMAS